MPVLCVADVKRAPFPKEGRSPLRQSNCRWSRLYEGRTGLFRAHTGEEGEREREKRYGCLFTCLVTRAVHIEVAHSLDTDSFLSALYRSIALRGLPELIHSDNGRNFVGADEELRALLKLWNQDRTQRGLAQEESSGCSTHPMLPTGGEYGNAKSEQYDEFLRA